MKFFFIIGFLFAAGSSCAQELFPYADPASNLPTHAFGVRTAVQLLRGVHTSNKVLQRYMPEVQAGLHKNLMVRAGANFSNMHTAAFKWEGARVYAKYRFLSNDAVHQHFRMAAFVTGAYSKNHLDHNEINLMMGEQSGVQGGVVATQLWHRFALSASGSWNEVFSSERQQKIYEERFAYQAINYSLSAGYLLLPFEYTDYNQVNINLYVEALASQNLNFKPEKFFVDLAPSVQAILKSTAKLNFSYRFQVTGDIYRLSANSLMVSFDYLFLNALKN